MLPGAKKSKKDKRRRYGGAAADDSSSGSSSGTKETDDGWDMLSEKAGRRAMEELEAKTAAYEEYLKSTGQYENYRAFIEGRDDDTASVSTAAPKSAAASLAATGVITLSSSACDLDSSSLWDVLHCRDRERVTLTYRDISDFLLCCRT